MTPPTTSLVRGPLEFVGMDISGILLKTLNGKKYVLVMKDCYQKLTRVVLTASTTASYIASLFLDKWAISYRIREYFWQITVLSLQVNPLSCFTLF